MRLYSHSVLITMSGSVLLTACFAGCSGVTDTGSSSEVVNVNVIKRDPSTGCWNQTTEEWPADFWSEQASDLCNEDDLEMYFERGGSCYHMSGTCVDWRADPEVTICAPPGESCCGSEDECVPE